MSVEKNKGSHSASPTEATRLNKPLILTAIGVLVFIVAVIFIHALMNASPHGQVKATTPTVTVSSPSQTPFNGLPGSYADAKEVNKVLKTTQADPQLKSQLELLKKQQQQLQDQLKKLNSRNNQTKNNSNTDSDEVRRSQIFFYGGSPDTSAAKNKTPATDAAKAAAVPATAGISGKEGQNMQGIKIGFMSQKVDDSIYNQHAEQYPISKYILQAGSFIPSILETSVNSDLPGPVYARVTRDVYDQTGRYLLIPQGSKLLGQYNSRISYGQSSAQVKFTRIIFPDERSLVIDNQMAVNPAGESGLADETDNHWGRVIGSALLSAAFSLPSVVATNQANTGRTCQDASGQYVPCAASVGMGGMFAAAAAQSGAQAAANVGSQIAQRSLDLQPTIILNKGYQFSVFVSKDLILPPYSQKAGVAYAAMVQ